MVRRIVAFLILALCLAWPSVADARRSTKQVIHALGVGNPSLSLGTKKVYAKAIRRAARKHSIDEYTLVSMYWHESNVIASRVSPDGEDFGLGQIRARYLKGCSKTKPARSDKSESCMAVKARLLSPTYNIAMSARIITGKRKACRRITGRAALFHRWLAAYGGTRGICGQAKHKGRWWDLPRYPGVQEIIKCRKDLINRRKCKRFSRAKRKRLRRLASRSPWQKSGSKRPSTKRSKRKRSKSRAKRKSQSRRTKPSSGFGRKSTGKRTARRP